MPLWNYLSLSGLSSFIIIHHYLSSCVIIYHRLSSLMLMYHLLSLVIIIYDQLSACIIHVSLMIIYVCFILLKCVLPGINIYDPTWGPQPGAVCISSSGALYVWLPRSKRRLRNPIACDLEKRRSYLVPQKKMPKNVSRMVVRRISYLMFANV
jgi:hypothetical protein